MSENSREEEKLSFKEQILRDLEQVKNEEKTFGETNELFSNLMNPSDLESGKRLSETSAQELIVDSVSTVDQLIANAPTVPPRPTNLKDDINVKSVTANNVTVLMNQLRLLNQIILLNLLSRIIERKNLLLRRKFKYHIVLKVENQALQSLKKK